MATQTIERVQRRSSRHRQSFPQLPKKFSIEVYPGKREMVNRGKMTYYEYLDDCKDEEVKLLWRIRI